ncbi:hypothetical protein SDRG_10094 [Saprolegnia diclina VS20]|uniref:RING-type domain-containing protein n=1 Tax=Saprolegnia diclina (strain VS20) TaxID=1156394 RepID=T0RQJ3_SAPDV|nr:hypothetical protein SDRG_10094 [Saprolegnia diclina VS20]EQC32347.1 hypothetical protein SDRG_10094 [Saprolegnia diclina VS20]|eukprot:XP_008614288.1 hypothetical protein SDRG_10094 [Saprolegnia diclina VS20]
MVASTDVDATLPRETAPTAAPTYWCHECASNVATIFNVESHELECQGCGGCFVEELEQDAADRPQNFVPPTAEPPRDEEQDASPPGMFRLELPARLDADRAASIEANAPYAQALPRREDGRRAGPLFEATSNGAARTTRNRIFTRTGSGRPVEVYISGGNAIGGSGLLNAIGSMLQMQPGQGAPATIGDYAFGNISTIINHLMQNDPTQHGAPPASKSVVESLPVVHITEEDVAKNQDCAVCKDMFAVKDEIRRLPCTHDFHPDCILPWLAQHNSCPVCRFELPTDDQEYENHKQRSNRASAASTSRAST